MYQLQKVEFMKKLLHWTELDECNEVTVRTMEKLERVHFL